MSDAVSALTRMVASLTEPALEALGSKGLLRRARKDIERGEEVYVAGSTESSVSVRVGVFHVTFPNAGPAAASCSCPAAETCQHILAAVLYLQGRALTSARADDASAEKQVPRRGLPSTSLRAGGTTNESITMEQLEQWAGKKHFADGVKQASQTAADITKQPIVRIGFPTLNSEVFVVPGAGLDGMIVSGGKRDARRTVVAAVIAFQAAEGNAGAPVPLTSALTESAGAPRTRAEIIDACDTLLVQTLDTGLSRLSAANQQRWVTLAVSALGAHLPRLALAVRGLGDEVGLALARDARSNLARLFARMADAHALVSALRAGGDTPRADLVGVHRTEYVEIGNVDLVGAAAWPWRTASGYEGLTVLFWEPSTKRWSSWTESRPSQRLGEFTAVGRYAQEGPWAGAESPRQLTRSAFRLMNARRNSGHRLSGSSKSRVLVTGLALPSQRGLEPITDWAELSTRASAAIPVGLKEANALDAIVAVRPATWAERAYDAVVQLFTWTVTDVRQLRLLLTLPFDAQTQSAIAYLESVPAASVADAIVIGRVQQTSLGLSVHPYAIHHGDGNVTQLLLDTASASLASSDDKDVEDDAFERDEDVEIETHSIPVVSRLLDEADDALLALAEAGLASPSALRAERLRVMAARADRLGLTELTGVLRYISAELNAKGVLRGSYLVGLHRRAASSEPT